LQCVLAQPKATRHQRPGVVELSRYVGCKSSACSLHCRLLRCVALSGDDKGISPCQWAVQIMSHHLLAVQPLDMDQMADLLDAFVADGAHFAEL
jgi:hypothetical protein